MKRVSTFWPLPSTRSPFTPALSYSTRATLLDNSTRSPLAMPDDTRPPAAVAVHVATLPRVNVSVSPFAPVGAVVLHAAGTPAPLAGKASKKA